MMFADRAGAALVLVALTLWLQCGGIAGLITWVRRSATGDIHKLGPFHTARLVVRLTTVMVALHVLEILLWASCYRWFCFPSWESAVYFSATSYSTVGYGDVTLPLKWRMLGPVESITGVLMCGISVSLLFAIATRLIGPDRQHFGEVMTGEVASRPVNECLSRAPRSAGLEGRCCRISRSSHERNEFNGRERFALDD